MNGLRFVFRYIRYFLAARTNHGVHSPFVYSLVTEVIRNRMAFYAYENIESVRSKLLLSKETITVTDFGAGSVYGSARKRKVSDIARNAAKSRKYGELLFRLVNRFQPRTMLELGTSLGVSTLYQAGANARASFLTLEGCPETAALARKNFDALKLSNIELLVGDFKDTLPQALSRLQYLDYVFFDGNHRKEATLSYFRQCLRLSHNDTVFVFDDIHWSGGMEEAWEEIKAHPQVTVTVDLFFLGLVFFRKEQHREHFTIRF
jgi:predicted O-methyltransferase YrrM